jgi:hypothetical protein
MHMHTYQIDYFCRGVWNPGHIVKMEPHHLKFYLEFLNGERPIVARRGQIDRCQKRCLPTRVRSVEPDWSQEDGYYEFDGISVSYVSLEAEPRLMPRPRTKR